MESCLRSKLKFSGCLAGTFAGVLCLDGFEFARMRMKSVPDEVEVVPACTVEAAGIALLEHEAPTNDRVDDDFWFSPTSGRPQRTAASTASSGDSSRHSALASTAASSAAS